VPFAYYQRLSRSGQAIYRRSDALTSLRLPGPAAAGSRPAVDALRAAREADDARAVAVAAAEIAGRVARALGGDAPAVQVLAVRPRQEWGELHGLYTLGEYSPSVIRVWMRTARHGRVVAFRTFLRTLLHEVCHHLDLTVLELAPSFHTEGFFKRESSLFHQLVPAEAGDARVRRRPRPADGK
jgi:hypothetical protein